MTVLTVERPKENLRGIPQSLKDYGVLPDEPIWRISVEHYHAMIRAGIISDNEPIELLEGMLVLKMAKNPPHHIATYLIRQSLERLVPLGWYVDSQEPITTLDSEPEPDITVVRGHILDYAEQHPTPQDVALVIEVAEATLKRDQGLKKRIYARAGVPVYWIVNLVTRQIEVYSSPSNVIDEPEYRQRHVYKSTDSIPVMLDGAEVNRIIVKDILPPLKAK
jgi:Uma2 family endonuclease